MKTFVYSFTTLFTSVVILNNEVLCQHLNIQNFFFGNYRIIKSTLLYEVKKMAYKRTRKTASKEIDVIRNPSRQQQDYNRLGEREEIKLKESVTDSLKSNQFI